MAKKYLDDNGVLYLWNKIKSFFVAKEDGKGLSTNDYTTAEKTKLAGISTGANKTVVDSELSSTSTNPVQNKVINAQITTLTSASHTHSNKDVLDDITSDDYTNWQAAKNKAHIHSNKDALDGITSTDVSSWNLSYLQTHEHENKDALDSITAIDTALSSTSTNPVQNKVIKTEFGKYLPLTGGTLTGTLTGTTFIGGLSGNAASATKLQHKRNINGLEFDGTADRTNYGSCSTAAATAAKEVSCAGFVLVTGAEITVKFTVTNTAASPTLNVNGTGAKPIYYRGEAISAGYLAANRTYTFRYNGTQYDLVGDIDTNTTYPAATTSKAGLMSAADKTKLDGIETGANKTIVDSELSSNSTNPVQNKTVNIEINNVKSRLNATNDVLADLSKNLQEAYDKFNDYLPLTGGTLTGQLTGTTFVGALSGNASSATKLATARNINGLSFDGTANRVNYGSCSTDAATAAKTVTCTGFSLVTGAEITVKFTVTNTAASPTLNVNSTGAKAIYYHGAAITAGYLAANRTYTFRYNGTQYDLVGDIDTNTTYSAATTSVAGLMSAADKTKLDGIATGANKTTVDSALSSTSINPVQNKVINTALASKVSASTKGQPNGVATLDGNGLVPSSQLPSYVDDVIEGYYYNSKFYKESAHTTQITGETGKIYVDLSTNNSYRYSGSTFVLITSSDMVAITNAEIDALCV